MHRSIPSTYRVERSAFLGTQGEALAEVFLEKVGYRLIMSNFKVPIGRNSQDQEMTGEIDIVALDAETLCFIEVKARSYDSYTPASIDVDIGKQYQIIQAGRIYKRIFGLSGMLHRYDAVTVVLGDNEPAQAELFKGFWTDEQFEKRSWSDDMTTDRI